MSAGPPKHYTMLFVCDLNNEERSTFQLSTALSYILLRVAGITTHNTEAENGTVHMTDMNSPTFGIAHDLYGSFLAELTHPRTSHSLAVPLRSRPSRDHRRTPQVRLRLQQVRLSQTLGGRQYSGISRPLLPRGP